ncbi:MAG TPA: ATP-binding protein [Verrucomicrobiae bacterium]|nr:ATP-binding protein [Verrucomicrobiae bacterium]
MSISQKIVRDHGGIISVSSIEGKGTTFRVNLPLI